MTGSSMKETPGKAEERAHRQQDHRGTGQPTGSPQTFHIGPEGTCDQASSLSQSPGPCLRPFLLGTVIQPQTKSLFFIMKTEGLFPESSHKLIKNVFVAMSSQLTAFQYMIKSSQLEHKTTNVKDLHFWTYGLYKSITISHLCPLSNLVCNILLFIKSYFTYSFFFFSFCPRSSEANLRINSKNTVGLYG